MCWGTLVIIGILILTVIIRALCGGSKEDVKKSVDDAGKYWVSSKGGPFKGPL